MTLERDSTTTESDALDCGCGPTPAEREGFWPRMFTRRGALGLGAIGIAAIGAVATPFIPAAFADDYPSWDDVQAAQANEAAKAAEVANIQALIQSLASEVTRTQNEAKAASDAFWDAQQAFFAAVHHADDLQQQADAQAAKATDAANKAGRVAAQLYRNGGDDTSLALFLSGSASNADDLLARLGTMDKLLERNQAVYADAVTARDSAQSLSDQAVVARNERDRLQKAAEAAMVTAQNAALAAQAALDAQTANLATLQAQLAALTEVSNKTLADYQAGVEAARIAKEAADKAAREAAEQQAQQLASAGGGGGAVISSGWARPNSGEESSGYGWRYAQCGNGYCASSFHEGVDLADWCGTAIYAAQSGTVVYAGYNGGYGNYIRIDHGGGIATGYGHIVDGGIYVSYGQWVNAGDLIAAEGNTGNSFGCHLHFEVYINGSTVDPVPFMAARGISV